MKRHILTAAPAAITAMLLALASLLLFAPARGTTPAAAGANFIATGHDMDYHCSHGSSDECDYFKLVVTKVRNGSTLPILALDSGTEVKDALANIGITGTHVVTIDPSGSWFTHMKFVTAKKRPIYSAIITASDSSCGGCDNTTADITAINARSADFATFFNNGGGILALAGADDASTYYSFVPLKGVAGLPTVSPYTPTAIGAKFGVTTAMANCCPTHNSFAKPPAPLKVLETDSTTPTSLPETIAAFGAKIGHGGFTGPTPTPTPKPTHKPTPKPHHVKGPHVNTGATVVTATADRGTTIGLAAAGLIGMAVACGALILRHRIE